MVPAVHPQTLKGKWLLHRTTPMGIMTGNAVFRETESGNSLLYREEGFLKLHTHISSGKLQD